MGAEDQRRVLLVPQDLAWENFRCSPNLPSPRNSGPLNIFREPMEMFKFRAGALVETTEDEVRGGR